jgi:2-oxoisovalerate dehydrogenase E2 component (dihydrolipoyl transacylase)
MTQQFALPDVGEGLTEAEIVNWHVAVGDVIAVNQVIVEIETAKSVVELPSPYAGTVTELHYPGGSVVPVGAPIIAIAAPGTSAGVTPESKPSAETAPTEVGRRQDVLVGYGPSHRPVARRPRRQPPLVSPNVTHGASPGLGKPPIRKLARDLGVDIRTIVGSGPGGVVTRDDVSLAAGTGHTASPTEHPNVVRTPIKGVRKATAEAMVASVFTAPHVTEWVTVDVTRSMRLLARLRADSRYRNSRISPLLLVTRAVLLTIQRYPQINAKWDASAQEIVEYRDVNVGIAAATPRGLIVPNIKAAQTLTMLELADALDVLIAYARAGRVQPAQMAGGTFTITNVGVFGVDGATPILNPGEAAILCVGQIRQQPWNHNGRIKLRDVATLALSFDHRLIDGELGSQVLAGIAALLERPALALSW